MALFALAMSSGEKHEGDFAGYKLWMSTLSKASTFFKHSALLGFIVWYSPAQLFFGD
jgi:hypothetical protein